MNRLSLLLGGVFFILVTPSSHAQANPDPRGMSAESLFAPDPLEPAPASMVLDMARLFNERESTQLSARLTAFASTNNVSVYVVAYSVLMGETIDQRANRLKDEWLYGKRGVVLVYQRGTERMTFSSTADPEGYLSRDALENVFASAYAQASLQDRGSSRVIAAVNQLMTDLPSGIEAQKNANQLNNSETKNFVGWAMAALAIFCTAGMFLFQFLRRSQLQVTKSYTFPHSRVQERFAAPYCGGHHAELQFKLKSPS